MAIIGNPGGGGQPDSKYTDATSLDSYAIDAFGRFRTSEPFTVFDSKQLFDNQPLFWDDSETSGSGTSSSHSTNTATTTISVSATTAGTRVRQTKMRFNYQPGKSQLILLTGILGTGESGITQRIGLYDDDNGLFFNCEDGTFKITVRTKTSGSAVDTDVAQSSFNLDKLDGTGKSGVTLDLTKTNIFLIDYEWLGVGRVRFGVVVDGIIYYCHQVLNANNLTTVYMSTPNLPLRYEISNDGTGGASSLEHICSTVISEGGVSKNGIVRYVSTNGTHVDANAADTIYAIVGIRLKTTCLSASILINNISMLAETNDDFEWILYLNPTVAGAFTYSDETNSCVQAARGATANTITGGTPLVGGWGDSNTAFESEIPNALRLGAQIDGTRDEIVLCARPLSSNSDIQGSITYRELV